VLPSGRFAIIGGYASDGQGAGLSCTGARSDGEVFGHVRRVWEPLPAEMAEERAHFSAAPVPGGLIVVGGTNPSTTEFYDEASNRWFMLPSASDAVSLSMVSVPSS
jgi:hypothetical protein